MNEEGNCAGSVYWKEKLCDPFHSCSLKPRQTESIQLHESEKAVIDFDKDTQYLACVLSGTVGNGYSKLRLFYTICSELWNKNFVQCLSNPFEK